MFLINRVRIDEFGPSQLQKHDFSGEKTKFTF